ncbi:AraC family transcriptional regulator [Pseudoteredinibacter isoporae]|uniref:AraC-like DNA-binding protein n=1 Tax=Pseudoteredinibacter isoporae TaxID=570281 RepID=A0A7X0JS46_9GAMM|nr:AraC family transcriptional regulator [Pseudoteredinibacter isoporae]MBB6521278.1 AraC-like DNA-binding protein [Pseudoteredinibacter isoporae]NHO86836.1 AraC family transcriptional regulator [Pseudoteredinibacter isoporae]NIB24712.1 AraC family transcriptional regulator [Pseudoteredinibacter isoporae]
MGQTIRMGSFNGYRELVVSLGGNPEEFAKRCNIPIQVFDSDDTTILFSQFAELLELTAKCLKTPDFGLRLGSLQTIDLLGPTSVAIQTAKNLDEAIQCIARFVHVLSPAIHFDVDDSHPEHVKVLANISLPNFSHRDMPQATDLAITAGLKIGQQLTGEAFEILKIEVPHEPLLSVLKYKEYCNTEIHFNTESIAWHFSQKDYDALLPLHSKKLHRFAFQHILEHYPGQEKPLSVLVEEKLRELLEAETCTRASIAKHLGIHPKTLQRKLGMENCSYDSIRDKVRRERVTYYLSNTDIPFGKIASLVGYRDQAALSRSCQRWFSKSPREIRGENKLSYRSQTYELEVSE